MRLSRRKFRSISCLFLLATGCLSSSEAAAQQPAESLEMQRLLERIERQDARLAELENELGQPRRSFDTANFRMIQEDEEGVDIEGVGGDDDPEDVPGEGTLEELQSRLEELEGGFGDLGEQVDSLGEKNLVRSGSSASTMKISGRVHLDAWGFDDADDSLADPAFEGEDPQNRIGFRRLRFGVAGDVVQNMTYKIEMEFAGGNDVVFKDAYLGWEELPFLQKLLLGNQKRPYGLDHLNSSRYNVFMERPFVIEAFNQDARRLGLASYGVSDDLAYNWRYGIFNQQDVADTGTYVGDHLQLELAGRFANTIWYDEVSGGRGYAHWAVSGTHADPEEDPAFSNEARFRTRPEARSSERWINTGRIDDVSTYQLLGLEGVVNVGPVQVVGEYQNAWVDRSNGSADVDFGGGYVYASYFLTGEHMPWDRESGTIGRVKPFENFWLVEHCRGGVASGWGAWQIAARYSHGDFSDADIFGGVGESLTLGVNWHWNANARMQFNYIDGRIDERAGVAAPGLLAADYAIYGARFMIDF